MPHSKAAPVPGADAPLRLGGVTKAYGGLRPLRIAELTVLPGERVAIAGIDAPGAELLVNLVTGASLPDEGEVRTFGRRTAEISNADDWLAWLDQFGIVSERGVLLEDATLLQNLALPFSLEIDPVPADIAERVSTLAAECGIPIDLLDTRASALSPDVRVRAHLARAVALGPRLLLVEHPTGAVPEAAREPLGRDIARVCGARALTALVITNDEAFASVLATRALTLEGATGRLRPFRKRWFR